MTLEKNLSAQTESSKRLDWIDQLKGLAILGIVLFHFFQNYPKDFLLLSVLSQQSAKVGYAAVDIFFVVAGFMTSYGFLLKAKKQGITLDKIDFKTWLFGRLIRIYPGYILAVISSLVLLYYFKQFPDFRWNLNSVISFLGLGGSRFQMINPGFWFFTVLLQAYIIMPLIFIITKGNFIKILVMGIVGGTIVKLLGIAFYSTQDSPISLMLLPYFWQNNFIGSYWLQLCLGLYWGFIFLNKKGFRSLDYLVSIQFFVVGIFLLAYLPTRGIEVLYKLGIDMLVNPFSFLALFWMLYSIESHQLLERLFAPLLQGLSILGKYSYQIYLLHQPLYFVGLSGFADILPVNIYLKPLLVFMIIMPILALYVTIFIQLENWVIKMIPLPKVFRPK